MPTNSIEITANNTIINYQGEAGEQVLHTIGVGKTAFDPVSQEFFTYVRNSAGTQYQIM